jgi:hypothetical protein
MKNLSKLVYASVAGLILAASGFAQADNCEHGIIANRTVANVHVEEGQICVLYQATVNYSITTERNTAIVIQDSFIGENIAVDNAISVTITDSTVSEGGIDVKNSDTVSIVDNDILRGSLRVTGNRRATVKKNEVDTILFCTDNNRIDSRFNRAEVDTCPNNVFN